MTGFARARRPLGEGELIVSVKTVNHRGLDIQVHAPSSVDPFETGIRSRVKTHLTRGHADVRISLPDFSRNGDSTSVNHELLEEYVRAFPRCRNASLPGIAARSECSTALTRHVR